jgi:hypothetical protein
VSCCPACRQLDSLRGPLLASDSIPISPDVEPSSFLIVEAAVTSRGRFSRTLFQRSGRELWSRDPGGSVVRARTVRVVLSDPFLAGGCLSTSDNTLIPPSALPPCRSVNVQSRARCCQPSLPQLFTAYSEEDAAVLCCCFVSALQVLLINALQAHAAPPRATSPL